MLIIVNTAFDDQLEENFDDEQTTANQLINAQINDDTAPNITVNDIETVLISVNNFNDNTNPINISANSCNGSNESPVDGEELDTSDNNTTNNTQTTAECDDKLIVHSQQNGSSSANEDDDDSNSKDNYDMNYDYDDEEDEENVRLSTVDDIKRKHNEEYDLSDVQNIEETQKLVDSSEKYAGDLEDCDYYSDGGDGCDADNDSARIRQSRNDDILKYNRGDGIIANRFIGLYFHLVFLLSLSLYYF